MRTSPTAGFLKQPVPQMLHTNLLFTRQVQTSISKTYTTRASMLV